MTRLRAGVRGLGVGRNHAVGYHRNESVDLIALAEPKESRLAVARNELGVESVFTDAEEMLAHAGLDIVPRPHSPASTALPRARRPTAEAH